MLGHLVGVRPVALASPRNLITTTNVLSFPRWINSETGFLETLKRGTKGEHTCVARLRRTEKERERERERERVDWAQLCGAPFPKYTTSTVLVRRRLPSSELRRARRQR